MTYTIDTYYKNRAKAQAAAYDKWMAAVTAGETADEIAQLREAWIAAGDTGD